MAIYKDFLGLNYCIYEPILDDPGAEGGNTLGYSFSSPLKYSDLIGGANPNITEIVAHSDGRTMVLLNLHRNGPYGYSTWKQIRVSDNHLSRAQRKRNIFTFTEEPGALLGTRFARFGETRTFTEPVVVDSYKPLSLVGDVSVYNDRQGEFQDRAVELKASFGNETVFFANKEVNEYFDTIHETDDNYEQLKELYLDGGLEDEGSPIDAFNLLVYRQTVFPKQQYAYLDETRSRKYYENLFWRDRREDRRRTNVDGGFGATIPSQSIWPLDAREDFESLSSKVKTVFAPGGVEYFAFDIGGLVGDNATSGPGVLQNRYTTFKNGFYYIANNRIPGAVANPTSLPDINLAEELTASIEYSRLHTLKNIYSAMNPSGIAPSYGEWWEDRVVPNTATPSSFLDSQFYSMPTGSIFNGRAVWDAGRQAGKNPFYDSYSDFSANTRIKGKGFSKVPEFRISNHVEFYLENGVTQELEEIFELSGAFSSVDSKTTDSNFYKILSTSQFLNHFDLVKSDHKDLSSEKIITLKCNAIKKFLPYKGFYPADRTVEISKQFYKSYKDSIAQSSGVTVADDSQFSIKPIFTPLFAPGILFNTIKSGMAVDFPLIFEEDYLREEEVVDIEGGATYTIPKTHGFFDDVGKQNSGHHRNNALLTSTRRTTSNESWLSIYTSRIPFEALMEPEKYLSHKDLILQEPHPYGLSDYEIRCRWDGSGNPTYKKMMSNFLAEVPDFFLDRQNFKTISSLEDGNPEFGNALSGTYYTMRVKMTKSRNKPNIYLNGYDGFRVVPPQDVADQSGSLSADSKFTTRETITMYSRPSAFGPPTAGDGGYFDSPAGITHRLGSTWGYNFPYTPPYYHGEAWCDLIFYADQTRKYSLEEILSQARQFPYQTRYWHPSYHDAMRDLTGYRDDNLISADPPWRGKYYTYASSSWENLISGSSILNGKEIISYATHKGHQGTGVGFVNEWDSPSDLWSSSYYGWAKPALDSIRPSFGPQSPMFVNYNAMQLDSSVNLFGKGTIRKVNLDGDATDERMEVASDLTTRGKTRWIIQPKFETPILNFNKYNDLDSTDCTPFFSSRQVPRGMWHQYGDLPKEDEGIYLQVTDIPDEWLRGALAVERGRRDVKSLADLVGFSKDPVRLGEVADVKEISEAVVAVPFIEKNGTRQFFSIPRADIDSCIDATRREVGAGTFVAGGPPKAGDSVYQMVKKMKKYVFPPSMDFVRYKEIDPFAMYIFEFKHNLTKQDLADIWQNLPPEIGTRMEEAEATISHELLAHELLGGGAVVKNGTLDDNAEGNGIPSNIQWMVFKAKKRAKTNYFDKVVAKKGTTEDTHDKQLENASGQTGDDLGVTYNWPYDFFSLVELVKLDAEVTFANIENDDKGQKTVKKIEKKPFVERQKKRMKARNINRARGKGRFKK